MCVLENSFPIWSHFMGSSKMSGKYWHSSRWGNFVSCAVWVLSNSGNGLINTQDFFPFYLEVTSLSLFSYFPLGSLWNIWENLEHMGGQNGIDCVFPSPSLCLWPFTFSYTQSHPFIHTLCWPGAQVLGEHMPAASSHCLAPLPHFPVTYDAPWTVISNGRLESSWEKCNIDF